MTRPRDAGMSLIEMLIVLAIVGVMASVVTLSIGAAVRGNGAESEARRLASHVRLAMDEALVTDRDIALAWDDRGYLFETRRSDAGDWVPDAAPMLGTRHDLSSQLTFDADTPGRRLRIAPNGDGGAAVVTIADAASAWRVEIDGYAAAVLAGRAP